jgi:catechol 2,3-dioxygenase-like lactoylglutathione lyase family enzyme
MSLHHVTAIASDPQRNLDFYTGLLGLRLVKQTVNFDDPGSYHFYFGDASGSPGTIMTFFPWPHARKGVRGSGEVGATAFAIPADSVGYWEERLKEYGVQKLAPRFGETVLSVADPDGMIIELIATATSANVQPWTGGSVPAEHAIRGFHSVTAVVDESEGTAKVLTESLGYKAAGVDGNRHRYVAANADAAGAIVDLQVEPDLAPARTAAGSVHHIAFRVPDDAAQQVMRRKLVADGNAVSPVMDRTYFHSIYFREPAGVLFEVATDNPGFATDETPEELGLSLQLPYWMEPSRSRIEEVLPKIKLPEAA